ncbi:hypothetical protein DW712_19250 [Bacteroides intestinalis]|uniref:Transposase DDE domain-containing protein n=2 Tax=Bacteroides intestinalis TaxID=329854 RepID=A0A414L3I6_9BACE|nr:hypothetical protein DW712_19250 [Bacteroides intestinalis]
MTKIEINSQGANISVQLFLHAIAYVLIHNMKNRLFKGTAVENFATDSFTQRIMMSSVHIKEKKTLAKVNFVEEHRYYSEIQNSLWKLTAA